MRKVTASDANQFAQVWRYKGVAIPVLDVHAQFAADFANVVLQSFIEDAQKLNAKRAAEQAKPRIIVEGIS